ncbi:30S ribosomal protein S17 [Candidatus Woesearchaeota archaeon]|nr:30S ribosomal protein S17 [Candidatus Woesearchaeota archaeon]
MSKEIKNNIRAHGRIFEGTVIATRMQKTATVEWTMLKKLPKYERYARQRTKVHAHNPISIAAEKGDRVRIQECRPLSKTKNFIIIEKLGKNVAYIEREQHMEESKFKQKKKEEKTEEGEESESS